MSAIVRKTYDTDSIVLRRIFAVDPETNTRVSTNSVLVTGTSGQATFQDGSAYLSTIGAPTSEALLSTVTGLGTIGYLSSGTAGDVTSGQLISTVTGLGNIYLSTGGGGEVTKANLTSTTQGLGTLSYLSSAQLISSFIGLSNLAVTQIVAGANISILPTTGIGTVTITATGGGSGSGDVTSTNLTSTTLGLATLGYLSSANDLLSTARFDTLIQSTVKGLATSDYISTSQLTSTVAGIAENLSTVYNISSLGEINISGTTTGFYINTAGANISTLINNNITINTTGGNVNDVDLTSTTHGLGTFGYVSSISLTSTVLGLATYGYISSSQLTSSFTSTLAGLGNVAVTKIIAGTNVTIDPANGLGIVTINASGGGGGGGSGDVTSTNLTSTTLGLGTLGYISASTLAFSLASTTANLARLGYVSSTALPSTVLGISRFYVSTAALQSNLSSFSTSLVSTFFTRRLFASTITADLLNISTISFGTGNGFITFPFVRATYISSFSTQTDYAIVNKYISGSQLQFSSIEGDGSLLTNLNTGVPSTVTGLGTFSYISSVSLVSTVKGLGSFYLSGPNIEVTGVTADFINTQNLFVPYADIPAISTNFISAGTATIPVLNVSSSFFLDNTQLTASTYISSAELKNLQINSLNVNSFGPVRVVVSTLGANHVELEAYDISKYFLFTQTNPDLSVALPPYDPSFEGWNCIIRNMPDSTYAFAVSTVKDTPAGTNIAPGTTITVIGSGNSYYLL